MHDLAPIEQETREDEIIVKMTDLGPPDQSKNSLFLFSTSVFLAWQRSPTSRRYLRWVNGLGILLLLFILFSFNKGFWLLILKQFNAPAQHSKSESIACLVDAAWSPDSRVIATLGYQSACYVGASAVLSLYDTHLHKMVAWLQPDEAIVQALNSSVSFSANHLTSKNVNPIAINYVHVAWSPDGKVLACTFNTISAQSPENGVVLMRRDGGDVRVLLQPESATAPFYAEWDLARSRPVPFTPPPSAASLMPLSPALAYHWGANGTLVPETPLTSAEVPAAPPPGPIGNPDGDASFTLWQPGSLNVAAMSDSSHLLSWSTTFVAWSPDGRYLVDGITLFGLFKLPGQRFPGASTLILTRMNQVPLLPLRDKALLKVIDTATALAWSPNGRVVAAYNTGKGVDLYECSTGDILASLPLHSLGSASLAAPIALDWSSDSSHLLITSPGSATTILWKPQAAQSELLSLTTRYDIVI